MPIVLPKANVAGAVTGAVNAVPPPSAVTGAVNAVPPPSAVTGAVNAVPPPPRTLSLNRAQDPRYNPSTISNLAHETMVNGMLGNWNTPVLNVTTNFMNALMSGADASARVLTSAFNKPENRTTAIEAVSNWTGLMEGVVQASKYVSGRISARTLGATETQAETLTRLGEHADLTRSNKIDVNQRSWSSEALKLDPDSLTGKIVDTFGALVNLPGTILNNTDVLYKIIQSNRVLSGEAAKSVAMGEHADFKTARQTLALDKVTQDKQLAGADYYTNMNRTEMPSLSWLTDSSVDKVPALRFVMPFKRAIAASLEQTIERSPLRFMSPTLNKQFFSADENVRATAHAKFLTGAALITSFGYAFKDNLNGTVPKPPNQAYPNPKDVFSWEQVNGPQNSIVFKSSTHQNVAINLDHLGVPGQYLKTLAYFKHWNSSQDRNRLFETEPTDQSRQMLKEFATMVSPVMETLYDSHWSKSIMEFSSMAHEAIQKNDPTRLIQYAEKMGVKMVPIAGTGWYGSMARAVDPNKKQPDKVLDHFRMSHMHTIKNVRDWYDWEGKQVPPLDFIGPGSGQFAFHPKDAGDPMTKFLVERNVHLAESNDYVQGPSYPNGVPGARVKYTDEEWAEFNRLHFEGDRANSIPSIRDVFSSMLREPNFRTQLTHEEQAHLMQRTYSYMNQRYADYLKREGTDLDARFVAAVENKGALVVSSRDRALEKQKQNRDETLEKVLETQNR